MQISSHHIRLQFQFKQRGSSKCYLNISKRLEVKCVQSRTQQTVDDTAANTSYNLHKTRTHAKPLQNDQFSN